MLATRMRMSTSAVDCTFVTSAVDTGSATTYTFADQSLGVAAVDRYIVVVASGGGYTRTLDSVTIGGVAATIVETTGEDNPAIGIAIAKVPTGTTGDIVVVFSGSEARAGIGVYRLTGIRSATPTATATDVTATDNALDASLVIPSGGCGIGYVKVRSTTTTHRTFVWTNLTEDFDALVEEGASFDWSHSGAMSVTAGTATRTATASGNIDAQGLVLAAWR